MTKKHTFVRQIRGINMERISLWAILLFLIVLQGISAGYIMKLLSRETQNSQRDLSIFINHIEERRYKYPVIDIAESRVYIPEARVYLPLNEATRDLRYNYLNIPGYKSLELSTSVGVQNETDDPACDRAVILSQSKEQKGTTYHDGGEIQPTKDGLRYLLVHNKDTCSIYHGNTQEELAKAAKSITQY